MFKQRSIKMKDCSKCGWLILFGFILNFGTPASGQDSCTTPRKAPGMCIAITQCPDLLALLQNRQRTAEETKFIRDSQCGFGPRGPNVCCATVGCTTADNTPGGCVALNDCPRLMQLFNGPKPLAPQTVEYIRKSVCQGSARYSVCCGSRETNSSQGISTTTMTTTTKMPTTVVTESTRPPVDVDALLPAPDKCGSDGIQDRIIGGNATNLDQYPWMGMVEYRSRRNTTTLACGATLISSRYVVTAAHCLFAGLLIQLGTPINVRLGEYDTRTAVDCVRVVAGRECNMEPVTIAIERAIIHPDFNPRTGDQKNDIAMIRLASAAPYTDFIRPICLPTSDITAQSDTDDLIVAGWGATETDRSSNVKLQLLVPLVPLASCKLAYSNPRLKVDLWDRQLCAGGIAGQDSCSGDSGGPLMASSNVTARWTLHGVVSFGPKPCAQANMPGVYTKVFSYIPWIRQQIRP